jgi:uncharacterized protein involved in exopolysaccharide biosynthesis
MSEIDIGRPAGPAGGQATTREFLSVLFRRKWFIIGLFLVASVTVVALSLTTPVTYQSSGRVLIVRGERLSALTPGRQIFSDWEEDLGSEVQVARSEVVVARAREILTAEATEGAPDIGINPGAVDAEVMGKTNVLGIGYTDLDPAKAERIANALITAYVEQRQSKQVLGRPESFFEAEMSQVDRDITRKLAERQRFSSATGVTDVEGQGRAWADQLGVARQRRNEAMAELAEARSSLDAMRLLAQDPNIDLPTLGTPFTNESALISLKQKIVEQQTRIAQLRERFRDETPEVQNAIETLETLQSLLRREVDARLTMSRSRVGMLEARLGVYENDIRALEERLSVMPNSQGTLGELDAEIKTLRERYDQLAKSRDQSRITANTIQGRNVVLLEPAGPARPLNTRDYVRMALAPAFALVLGIGLAFFIDGLDLTVRSRAQAEEYLELPVLASLAERRTGRV